MVVNKVRTHSHEHQFRIAELRDHFGSLVMPVALPDRLAVQQAQGACMPIHQWNTPGAREVALAFNLLLARVMRTGASGRHHTHVSWPQEDGDHGVPGDVAAVPEGDTVFHTALRLSTALGGRTLTRGELRHPRLSTVDLAGRVLRGPVRWASTC